MNPLAWFLDGAAEMVVAYREDRMLYQISRRAWTVTFLCIVTVIWAFTELVSAL